MKLKMLIKNKVTLAVIAVVVIGTLGAIFHSTVLTPTPSQKTLNYSQNIELIAPAYSLDTDISRVQPVNAHRYEIVMLYKTGCHTCENMRKNVYRALSEITTSDPIDIVNISSTSELGRSLLNQYQTRKSPMLFVIDKNTNKITLYYNHVDSKKLTNNIKQNIISQKD